jgi:hypothetical protein
MAGNGLWLRRSCRSLAGRLLTLTTPQRHTERSLPAGQKRELRTLERPLFGCAVERRRFSVGESPTRQDAPAGSNRSNCGGNEAVEASGVQRVTIYGDVASVQAVTRVNAEQASKRTMCGPTRPCFRGRLTWVGEQEQKR